MEDAPSCEIESDALKLPDVLLPQLTGDYALRLLNEVLLLFREVDFVESGVIEEKLNVVHQFIKEFDNEFNEQKHLISMLMGKTAPVSLERHIPSEVSLLQDLVRELSADAESYGRVVSHLRAERERSAVAYRTVISHQARDCKSMRKKLQQASADVEVFKKEQFRLEQSLQSCVMEVAIATQSVNESRSRERVSTRRIKAAIEREKEERRKSSVQYSKTILDLRRDSEQLMVELQSEKQNRAKDIKDWEIVVAQLEAELAASNESCRLLQLEVQEEKRFKDAANLRINDVSTELLTLQGEIGQNYVLLRASMLENELLEHKIKESSARQLHLDTLKEANIKTLSDSVKISNETAMAALLDLDTVRFQSAKNEISDSITLDFDLKDSVATNNLQNIISAVNPLIRESREASPMLDEIMLRKQLQTAVIERDTAVSDMDIQEMQHLAEMEALESNLESVQYRLDTLSAENDILRQQASGASAQNYGRMSDIFTPFDTSTSPGYGTINSLSDQTDPSLLNDQVAARITIENLEAEVTRLQLALTATERANSIATEEFEHIKANLVADLAASEKALFENNERDAIFLTTRNENQKSVITANTDFIETQRMKIADYEKDTAISDNETINSYKQELQVSLVRSAVAEQRIVMLEAELLKVTDDQKKLGLDHNKNMLDIAAKKEEINALEKQLQAVQLNIEIRNRELESTTALNQQSSNDIDTLSYWLSTENDLKNFDTSSICSTPKLIQIVEDIKKTQFHLEHRIQHDSKFEEQAHVVAHQTNIIEGLRQLLREKEESYAILLAQLDSKQVLASNSDSTSRSINFKESSTQYDDWIRDDVGKDSRELIQLKLQLKSLESAVDTEKSVSASLKQNLDDELAKNNQLQENCLTLINNLEKLKVDSKIASDKETFDVLKSRNDALSRQLRSTPPSLLVAQAEKRVLECRLSQLKDELQICLTDEQKKSAQIQFELNAFMRREEIEKGALLQKIQSQSQTIHQLTRHLNQLQTSIQKEESFGNSGLSGTANPILPLPWPLSDPLQEKWGGDALMLRVTSDKQDISSEQKSHFQLASSGNGNQTVLGDYDTILLENNFQQHTARKYAYMSQS